MNFKEEINKLLKKNMTEDGYKLWKGIDTMIPDIWNKGSSSTGKYHKKKNGEVASIAEHTYEMLYAATKIFRMLNIKLRTPKCDGILFSISLHDRLKYGEHAELPHTTGKHDQMIGDLLELNQKSFSKIMTKQDWSVMVEAARYHSGQWSTDVNRKNMRSFNFKNFNPETMFVHMLDMLSTANCLKFPETN